MGVQEDQRIGITERIDEYLVGRVFFRLSNYLYNRRRILRTFEALRRSERYPEERLRELQLNRVKDLIGYADRWIPFYRRKFREIGLKARDITDIEDLRSIPPLGRQDVMEHYRDMVDIRCRDSIPIADLSQRGPGQPIPFARFRRHKLIRNTSSGSTGAPTTFYDDGTRSAVSWAHELRFRDWYGISPGAREARMARISTDYRPDSKVIVLRELLWNQLVLPGVNLSEEDYAVCRRKMVRFKPRVLWGFTSALVGLADYLDRTKGDESRIAPRLVIAWAAPLYEHEERILTRVFGCPVTNIYGAREVGHIAAICPEGSWHINQEHLFVEIEDDGKRWGEDALGEILVTTLDGSPMPFIRYRMGDLGEISGSKCPCGRTTQVLSRFVGRTGEVFITRDGRMISPNFWCRTFMDESLAGSIRRFQVVYRRSGGIRIRLVPRENYSVEMENRLRDFLQKNFHPEVEIEFEYMQDMEPGISGKYQMVSWEDQPIDDV